jgi:2-haloacid dehalogenase
MQGMPIRAILFDVYGTLLDVHSAIAREGKQLGAHADAVSRQWRQKQLEYTWVWSLRGEYRSFQALTESALDYALAAHGVKSSSLKERLLSAYRQLDAFPEVATALADLRQRGLRLAALSNGDPDMLEAGLQSAGLRHALDAILSVAPLRIYKPDPQIYELGRSWANAPAQEVAFLSANAWDAGGAAAFGFRTFWIDRAGQPPEYDLPRHATIVPSLSAIAAHLA